MKLAVLTLIILGMLAAGSAAFLFQWVQARDARAGSREIPSVEVLVANADLPARTRLTGEHIVLERVPRAGLPSGYFTNQAQAIGKTLKMAVAQGQPLAESCCIPPGSIDDLLRPGMLAFPVPLARRSTSVELLYPGCIVDVFATFPLRDKAKGEAVVTPLLQNIQVLGVADETVLSAAPEESRNVVKPKSTSEANVTVTLEVNARQAAALQLAMERATLGLAMRNPLDKDLNPMEPMIVKEGQLTTGSEAMDPQTLALFSQIQQMLGAASPIDANDLRAVMHPAGAAMDPNLRPMPAVGLPQKPSIWQTTIIRGQKVEEAEFDIEEAEQKPSVAAVD